MVSAPGFTDVRRDVKVVEGAATIVGNSTADHKNIKLPPGAKRAVICAENDVLALNIQNTK